VHGLARRAGRAIGVIAALVAVALITWAPSRAQPTGWTTYFHDPVRSGVDPDQPAITPSAVALAWTQTLDGHVFAEPLVFNNQVFVATEANSVYALDAATGAILWRQNVGPPVTGGLPCGDIVPIGITSTPVIDPAAGVLYAVATVNPVHYELWALNLNAGGSPLYHFTLDPGFDPSVEGQRGALTLANGRIYVPFGGRAGDCGDYHGWMLAVNASDSGGSSLVSFEAAPNSTAAGLWQPAGGVLDGSTTATSGDIFVVTGNLTGPVPAQPSLSESVIRLHPGLGAAVDSFTPSDWMTLNAGDLDVGSVQPALLPGGLVFQSGKSGVGYLLNAANLGGVGSGLFKAQACDNEAIGATATLGMTIFLPCTGELVAIHVNTGSPPSFTRQVMASDYSGAPGAGPPIVSGGIVWSIDIGHSRLLALDPASGQQRLPPISLPNLPDHFVSPSSGGGRLFVPDGLQVLAFALQAGPLPTPTSTAAPTSTPTSNRGVITPLPVSARVIDTRFTGGPIAANASRCFTVVGMGGIPTDASAVVLNVTAVDQTTNGWLSVYPNGQAAPATSTLNFGQSEYAIANGAIERVGAGGQVCVKVGTVGFVPGSSQVILDATGYVPAANASVLNMLAEPTRLADTRAAGGPLPSGTSRCFQVAGVAGIPGDAAAVVLNVTATGYGSNGWLTAYPNGQAVPSTSTLNFGPAQYAMANNAIMRIGAGGEVCLSVGMVNSVPGSSQVILDAIGYMTPAGLQGMPMLASPQRVVDTRLNGGPIQTGSSRCFSLAGVAGVPSNATGLVLNLTAVGFTTHGWVTGYPAGTAVPTTSTLNFDTSEYAIANGAIVANGAGGQVCMNIGTPNNVPGSSQTIIDLVGYLAN
jgi:outer membrane protein assembly factor BamB